jgi:hypothetical protein
VPGPGTASLANRSSVVAQGVTRGAGLGRTPTITGRMMCDGCSPSCSTTCLAPTGAESSVIQFAAPVWAFTSKRGNQLEAISILTGGRAGTHAIACEIDVERSHLIRLERHALLPPFPVAGPVTP